MRLDGWEARLFALVEDARARPYRLGEHDCFRLACRVVEALTGVDRWPEFAGYTTEREAKRAMRRRGSSFEAAGDWFFGAAAVDVRQYRRGDIAAIETPDGDKHLGVVLGARTAFMAEAGLVYVRTSSCLCCWRVG